MGLQHTMWLYRCLQSEQNIVKLIFSSFEKRPKCLTVLTSIKNTMLVHVEEILLKLIPVCSTGTFRSDKRYDNS